MTKFEHTVVIVAWDGVSENVNSIQQNLNELAPYILNSTLELKFENDIKVANIYFDQIEKALQLTRNGNYLTYISGDSNTKFWLAYLKRVQEVCDRYQPYVYSPYITYEGYPTEFVGLGKLKDDPFMELAVMTDGIQFSLHPELVKFTMEFIEFVRSYSNHHFRVGWGLDWAWNIYAIYSEKLILRDRFYEIYHPNSTSYTKKVAEAEFRIICDLLTRFFDLKYGSKLEINRIIYAVSERIKLNPRFLDPKEHYSDEVLSKYL